jgi:plastocyanin
MKSLRTSIVAAAVLTALAFPAVGRADDKGKDKDKDNKVVAEAIVVHFGQAQPQTPDAAPVGASVTHFLTPNDVTIKKGQAVNFVINGGGHGVAIHAVSKDTTREDIAQDLCDGATAENPDPIVDRRNRAAVCNGTAVTPGVTINGTTVSVTGTQNLDYKITDGKEDLVIQTGFNVNIAATPTTPAVVVVNPRVDDIQHSHRLLGTSGRATGDATLPGANPAGAFLTGSAPPATPGNRINVQFLKAGRYLVICMNRAHSLNDHMFGFVNVVGDDDDE